MESGGANPLPELRRRKRRITSEKNKKEKSKMPKIHVHKKSKRGKDIKCGKCGKDIAVGEQYKTWSKRTGFGRVSGVSFYRCMKSGCAPRESELASGRTAEMTGIQEQLDDALDNFRNSESPDLSGFYGEIDEVISAAESLRDEIQESFDNLHENFQQGDTGQTMETRIENLDSFIDELNSAKDQNDESVLDDDEIEKEIESELDDDEPDDESSDVSDDDDDDSESEETRDDEKARLIQEKRQEVKDNIIGEFEGISLEM
jgi:DNA-directed RNA polymerase subunit M/transcription elongation factor TFIIS